MSQILDYPALWAYTRDIYQTGKIKNTVVFDQMIKGFFVSNYVVANVANANNPYLMVKNSVF